MPTSKELVANRPLTGQELSKIILADLAFILARDTMLSAHVAYGRVSYDLRVTLHMDNPAYPEHTTRTVSIRKSDNELVADPSLSAIEGAPPLTSPSKDSVLHSTERHRSIESPNLARLEHGLPVTIIANDSAGHAVERKVVYPAEAAEGVGTPPSDMDVTSIVKGEMMAKGILK